MLENLALGRGDLDRLAHRRSDPVWFANVCADPDTFVVGVAEGSVAVDHEGLINLRPLAVDPARAALIGSVHERVYVALLDTAFDGGRSLRDVGAALSDDEAAIATAAVALQQWHRSHTHCPRCGAPTVNALAGWERHCSIDGSAHYPRTDPAVIVVITDAADRILLARQQVWPQHRFSLVAGYVEPGETAEQALAREVMEEVGIAIGVPTFLGSQPWPFPASLMLCYQVRAITDAIHVDGVEIAEAQWLSRDDLLQAIRTGRVLLPSRVSIARRAIEHWFGALLED